MPRINSLTERTGARRKKIPNPHSAKDLPWDGGWRPPLRALAWQKSVRRPSHAGALCLSNPLQADRSKTDGEAPPGGAPGARSGRRSSGYAHRRNHDGTRGFYAAGIGAARTASAGDGRANGVSIAAGRLGE